MPVHRHPMSWQCARVPSSIQRSQGSAGHVRQCELLQPLLHCLSFPMGVDAQIDSGCTPSMFWTQRCLLFHLQMQHLSSDDDHACCGFCAVCAADAVPLRLLPCLQEPCQTGGYTLSLDLWASIRNSSCQQACLHKVPSCTAGVALTPAGSQPPSSEAFMLQYGSWSPCLAQCSNESSYRALSCTSSATHIPVRLTSCTFDLQTIQVSCPD